ncbi:MAG: P1 family peptidase [Ectothiorhodospiraceae bacterium]|nr:P1 family peptidase [Ectothiorhodospiraceae bacterium]
MPRARELGLVFGPTEPGPHNAITDVPGVAVGHLTLLEGERIRTGVTAIVPHGGNPFREKVPAGLAVMNGYGKLAGATQLRELGEIETAVLLTNTLAVGRAMEGAIRHVLDLPGNERVGSVNAVVGETNDGRLNDIRDIRVTADHALAAIASAADGAVAEGVVGAGTGTVAFGYKGGIGTSSRRVAVGGVDHRLGVLVQSNYGGRLTLHGHGVPGATPTRDADGSVMIVIATDAAIDPRGLERLALRAFAGIARTGSTFANGSGDYAIAFSTHPGVRRGGARGRTADYAFGDALGGLFEAAADATEEAVWNSLLQAHTVDGWSTTRARPARVEAIDPQRVRDLVRRRPAPDST